MLKKSLIEGKSLTVNKKATRSALISDNFKIEIMLPMKSVDVKIAFFRNFIDSKNDKEIEKQIKRVVYCVGTNVRFLDLPIKMPEDERNFYLVNDLTDKKKIKKYNAIRNEINFTEAIDDVVKFEFENSAHRVFLCINDGNPKTLKILFFDPFHHVAIGKESRKTMAWPYIKCCNSKHDCLSTVIDKAINHK